MRLFQKKNKDSTEFKADDIINIIIEVEDNGEAAYEDVECEEEDQEEVEKLYQENQRIKENQICKICLDDEASVIFLPCGHIACCPQCASAFNNCPLCRCDIGGTVKAYFE